MFLVFVRTVVTYFNERFNPVDSRLFMQQAAVINSCCKVPNTTNERSNLEYLLTLYHQPITCRLNVVQYLPHQAFCQQQSSSSTWLQQQYDT
jgi:hypothetical protein